jgi:hypothetical protein
VKGRCSGARAELRERLDAVTRAHRDAVEVNDALLQGMVAAMWSLEGGRREDGLRTLRDTINLGHHQVSRLMREASMGPRGLRGRRLRQRDGSDDRDEAGRSA